MTRDIVMSVRTMLAERRVIAEKEKRLVKRLSGPLRALGYEIVPRSTANGLRAPAGPRRQARKPLACPHCARRFALPLHLGRHVAAAHARTARARKRAR